MGVIEKHGGLRITGRVMQFPPGIAQPPRGGMRISRGACIIQNRMVVNGFEGGFKQIKLKFQPSWPPLASHPLMLFVQS